MGVRTRLEGLVDFYPDYNKEYAMTLGLNIMSTGYSPETYKDKLMAQPGVFVFNTDGKVIYKYVKEGSGPFGRPLPNSFFRMLAKHAEEHKDKSKALPVVGEKLVKTLEFHDKDAYLKLTEQMKRSGVNPI